MNTSFSSPINGTLKRPHASWGQGLVTIALGLWLIAGVFIDGFAHNNLRSTIESFFTPWHAILYSGFVVAAIWTTWLVALEVQRGHSGWNAIPVGYELGLLGVLVFGAGGIGDLIWHALFGIEADVAALLSPTHLLLLTGGTLLVTSPLRSGWATLGRQPRFWAFLPTLLSSFAALSFVSFFHLYGWGLTGVPDSTFYMDFLKQHGDELMVNYASRLAAMGALFSNVVLMTLVLLLVRRWHTPLGTFTLIFTLNTFCMSAINGSVEWFGVLASAVSGLFADAFIAWRDPSPVRVLELRWLSALLPLVIWGSHYLVRQLTGGLSLEFEIWTGVTVMTALTGLVMGVLAVPPSIPGALEAH